MKGVRTCFTAVLVDGKIYFLATAENTAMLMMMANQEVLLVALTLKR
jgi:hypothetical protein